MTIPKTIELPQTIYDKIIAHSLEGEPEEVCGIISGAENRATELVRGRNVAPERIIDYRIDDLTLLKQFDFEDRGETMLAIYHSHPESEAYPSATDALNAHYPDSTFLICSLEHPEAPIIRAFRMWQEVLTERPGGLEPVRGNPKFLANQQDGEDEEFYLLASFTEDGEERWQKVWIVEQQIVCLSDALASQATSRTHSN